jgi:AcrR family transcriptional regulator
VYRGGVPRLWNATIDEHRRSVQAAILDTTAALVAEHGVAGVTMSQIAQAAGIGRATLYKYFPDVEAIMLAWHERQVGEHLRQLTEATETVINPAERLHVVLHTYAQLAAGDGAAEHSVRDTGAAEGQSLQGRHGHGLDHGHELAGSLHQAEHMYRARQHLHAMVTEVIRAAAESGEVRDDIPATELASYCLHALSAARDGASAAARDRLITVTLAGLRPVPQAARGDTARPPIDAKRPSR